MGIFFTLVYVLTTYLAPSTVFGDLAQYHLEEGVALLTAIASCFNISGSGVFKMPQTYGVLAMFGCLALSLVFNGLTFSVPSALIAHLSSAIVFFFILWNFRTPAQIKLLVATLLLTALLVIYQGASAVYRSDLTSPWVFMMGYGDGRFFSRIRGLGFINDPNDLCQFLVGLIPCIFIFWQRGKFLRNTLFVLLPVAALSYGMFLTHSRGGMVGLVVALIVLGRRKIGILPALITGAVGFLALSAIGWSGGRDISAESGADRMEAWATGLTLIRTHPLFGVGFKRFDQYFYITAHNTVVVCAAEIGIVGLFCWMLMVVPTLYELVLAARPVSADNPGAGETASSSVPLWSKAAPLNASRISSPVLRMAFAGYAGPAAKMGASSPVVVRPLRGVSLPPDSKTEVSEADEIQRLCGLMIVSLSGFFAAGWFLSRSFTMLVFVNIGLALAIHRLAVERGLVPVRLTLPKAAKYSGIATVVVIAFVYALLRVNNLLPK